MFQGDYKLPLLCTVTPESPAENSGLTPGYLLVYILTFAKRFSSKNFFSIKAKMCLRSIQGMDAAVLTIDQVHRFLEERPLTLRFGKLKEIQRKKDKEGSGGDSGKIKLYSMVFIIIFSKFELSFQYFCAFFQFLNYVFHYFYIAFNSGD